LKHLTFASISLAVISANLARLGVVGLHSGTVGGGHEVAVHAVLRECRLPGDGVILLQLQDQGIDVGVHILHILDDLGLVVVASRVGGDVSGEEGDRGSDGLNVFHLALVARADNAGALVALVNSGVRWRGTGFKLPPIVTIGEGLVEVHWAVPVADARRGEFGGRRGWLVCRRRSWGGSIWRW